MHTIDKYSNCNFTLTLNYKGLFGSSVLDWIESISTDWSVWMSREIELLFRVISNVRIGGPSTIFFLNWPIYNSKPKTWKPLESLLSTPPLSPPDSNSPVSSPPARVVASSLTTVAANRMPPPEPRAPSPQPPILRPRALPPPGPETRVPPAHHHQPGPDPKHCIAGELRRDRCRRGPTRLREISPKHHLLREISHEGKNTFVPILFIHPNTSEFLILASILKNSSICRKFQKYFVPKQASIVSHELPLMLKKKQELQNRECSRAKARGSITTAAAAGNRRYRRRWIGPGQRSPVSPGHGVGRLLPPCILHRHWNNAWVEI